MLIVLKSELAAQSVRTKIFFVDLGGTPRIGPPPRKERSNRATGDTTDCKTKEKNTSLEPRHASSYDAANDMSESVVDNHLPTTKSKTISVADKMPPGYQNWPAKRGESYVAGFCNNKFDEVAIVMLIILVCLFVSAHCIFNEGGAGNSPLIRIKITL